MALRSDAPCSCRPMFLVVLASLLLQPSWAAAADEVITRQAIVRQLAAPRQADKGLVIVEDAAPGGTSPEAPSIDLPNISFELDSSELTPAAQAQLDELAAALASAELQGFRFQIIGHTDARGHAAYNQALSERRAAAVRNYLVRGGTAAHRLEAAGRGATMPIRPDDPRSPENRRVQIRNAGAQQ